MPAIFIQITTIGANADNFSLYSNLDGFTTPFETGVSSASLLAGYVSFLVPLGTTIIRAKSTVLCINFIDIPISYPTTTTTTTTTSTTTAIPFYSIYPYVDDNFGSYPTQYCAQDYHPDPQLIYHMYSNVNTFGNMMNLNVGDYLLGGMSYSSTNISGSNVSNWTFIYQTPLPFSPQRKAVFRTDSTGKITSKHVCY
jgi:hypothetical protein